MENLYAPWRNDYVRGKEKGGCVFCDISAHPEKDDEHTVLYRDEICFAVMNKYPYTPGHFMIIPHLHTDSLEALPPEHWQHIALLAQKGVAALKEEFHTNSVNIGMNLGDAAGAGIAEHIHLHLLPRWHKDTNFITVIGDARIYSVDFGEIYRRVKSAFLAKL
jgi:diadenosine tetraphosphate (Ap4A) HIT family hydrolase